MNCDDQCLGRRRECLSWASSRYTSTCVCVQQLLLLFDSRSDDFVPKSVLQSQILPSRLLPGTLVGAKTIPALSIPRRSARDVGPRSLCFCGVYLMIIEPAAPSSFSSSMNMTTILSQASKRFTSYSAMSRPTQRVAQVRRHLSSSSVSRGEIRDAYVLSAARTPTGKVQCS